MAPAAGRSLEAAEAVRRPRTREAHAVAAALMASLELADRTREVGLAIARHEHAEPRDRGGLRAFGERLAVHAPRYRAGPRPGPRGRGPAPPAARRAGG